jgi:hypothetical protein
MTPKIFAPNVSSQRVLFEKENQPLAQCEEQSRHISCGGEPNRGTSRDTRALYICKVQLCMSQNELETVTGLCEPKAVL